MNIPDLDKSLFFLINQGASNAVFDKVMSFITSKGYLLIIPHLLYILYKAVKGKHKSLVTSDELKQQADNRIQDSKFKIQNSRFKIQKDSLLVTRYSLLIAVLWAFILSVFAFLLSDWLSNEIKHIIMRIRPCNALEGVNLLVGCTKSYSMPSNHATNSFATAVVLYYFARQYVSAIISIYPLVIASLVAFSRVYVGVHYPSDVMVGAFLGTAVAFVIIGLFRYASFQYKTKPYLTVLSSSLFVISVFRVYYILHGPLDLSPDEAHYWEWSRRLDLSYYSKGPMIAYLIFLSTSIFGDTVLGIRLMAVIFSALSSIYMFKLVNYMYPQQAENNRQLLALSSALLLQIIPMFAPFGVIFTIDSPFIFFWIFSLYLFYKAINKSNESPAINSEKNFLILNPSSKSWILLGVFIGIGLLTKYTMAFFYLCAFLLLLFSEKRYLLKTVGPYLTLLISLVVFSPVIIWNFQHDWVTIRHTAGQAHISEGFRLSLKNFVEFIGSQVGAMTPVILIMMFYALFKLRKDNTLQSSFLLYFSIPVIGFFLLKSIHGKVQTNWAMTGYITGIIAVTRYYFSGDSAQKGSNKKDSNESLVTSDELKQQADNRIQDSKFKIQNSRFKIQKDLLLVTRYSLLSFGVALALFVSAVAHYPSIIKLSPKLDPSSRLRGWKELGNEVSSIYDSIRDKGKVFIFSDRYQVSSELAFYVKENPKTYCINIGRRMNQYDLWPDMNSDALKIRQDKKGISTINAIFVRIGDVDMPKDVAEAFEKYEKRLFKVYDKGYLLREYSIFICYNFKGIKTVIPEVY